MARVACGRAVARLREAVDEVCFLVPAGVRTAAETVLGGSGEGLMEPAGGAGGTGFCRLDDVTMAQIYVPGVPGAPEVLPFCQVFDFTLA
jgi:hypothetical protein